MARFTRTLVALVLLVVPTTGLVASTSTAANAAPAYGPWSSEVVGLQGRVAPLRAGQPRVHVQFRRSESSEGRRQVRMAYRITDRHKVTRPARNLAPGAQTRFRSAKVPCGKNVTIFAQARTTNAAGEWLQWHAVSAKFKRTC